MNHENDDPPAGVVTRRVFLGTAGVGALGSVLPAGGAEAPAPEPLREVALELSINGRAHRLEVEARTTLLELVRERVGLTGTKPGCERGECGACTVLVDGVSRYACLTLAAEAEGREVTTVEGLLEGEALSPLQQAFVEEDALQCGFCTPGQVMAAEGLLRQTPRPTPDEIRHGMSGNLCRCGAYAHIFEAVRRAAERRQGPGGA